MNFAEKVRKAMKARGWSQAKLAELLGTRQQVVNRWLDANQPPKAPYLVKLARVVELPIEYLLDDTQDDPPMPELTEDERFVLQLYRDLGLSREEGVRRLACEGRSGGGELPTGEAETIRRRDLSEIARREEKRRLGFELDPDAEGAGPDYLPPVRGKN